MYSPPVLLTPGPAPVSLADIKRHCRADDFADDDMILQLYLDAAIDHLEGFDGITGRSLRQSTFTITGSGFCDPLLLPLPDVHAASVQIDFIDDASVTHTVPIADFFVTYGASGHSIGFADTFSAPDLADRPDAVTITFTAGYAPADCPAALKAAILLMCAHWFENREAGEASGDELQNIPRGVSQLAAPYRMFVS